MQTWKTFAYAYGGFALLNYALAWATSSARTGRIPGQNQLLDLNDKLMSVNVLAWAMPIPIAAPGSAGPPQVTQFAASVAPTVTQYASGTTTTFSS